MEFAVGDSIAQFFERKDGAMGMLNGIVTEVRDDLIKYKTSGNKDVPDGEEIIVTIDLYETLI